VRSVRQELEKAFSLISGSGIPEDAIRPVIDHFTGQLLAGVEHSRLQPGQARDKS
jgi:hypothetical protein